MANRGYEGEVILFNDFPNKMDDSETSTASTTNKAFSITCADPYDGELCDENCSRCLKGININEENITNIDNINVINCDVKEDGDDLAVAHNHNCDINDEYRIKCYDNSGDTGGLRIIKGTFFMVNGANISCACARSPNGFSKYCHTGDGYVDVVLIRHTTFFNNLRLFLTLSKKNSNIVSTLCMYLLIFVFFNYL